MLKRPVVPEVFGFDVFGPHKITFFGVVDRFSELTFFLIGFAVFLFAVALDELRRDFRFVVAERNQRVFRYPQLAGDFTDGLESCRLGDFDVAFHCHGRDSLCWMKGRTRILAESAGTAACLTGAPREIRISPTVSRSCRCNRHILPTCRKMCKKSTYLPFVSMLSTHFKNMSIFFNFIDTLPRPVDTIDRSCRYVEITAKFRHTMTWRSVNG